MQQSDGNRIARNTLYLYIRMGVMMIVRLYTVRVVLQVLGIDDYGLWNVIMAFVTGFTFISPTLVSSTQRFLNYEMGSGGSRLTRIFSTSCMFFALLAVLLAVALETFGLWFLNTRMQVPEGMYPQANWAYQFCVLTLVADMVRMPYEAVIVAKERMSFYAVVSLLEAVLLLGIVFLLPLWHAGWLLGGYGVLTFVAHAGISGAYAVYAHRHAAWARLRRIADKRLVREMASFSGWNIFGSMASMLAVQGINVLMNVYFGVAVNSAYGVALQVHTAVFVCVVNISKAASPGIVKDYAAGALDSMRRLVMNVGKFSFLLILMPVIPAAFNIDTLLTLWLGAKVPPGAPEFCVLIMAQVLVVSFTPAIDSAVFATGRIRNYQLVLSALIGFNFIATWVLYACGVAAVSALWIKVGVEVLILGARIVFMQRLCGLPCGEYLRRTLLPSLGVTAVALPVMWVLMTLGSHFSSLARMFVTSAVFLPLYAGITLLLAFTPEQRAALMAKVKGRLR